MTELEKLKVRERNHLPGTGDDRFPVYSKQFNNLIEAFADGTISLDVEDLDVDDDLTVGGDLTVTGTTTLNGALVLGDAAADSLTINATATYAEPINYDNATGITAFATGGQASATALTAEINNVTTCATAGDSVKLPAAVAGKKVVVKNSGATALDIFPASSDSIDALAVNLAVRIQPGSVITFHAKDATVWESDRDSSLTLIAPTTNRGQLEVKASDSAGNTVTTITNASQAADRRYTLPDAGADASFVMTEGAQTINGAKTFGSVILAPNGTAALPTYSFTNDPNTGIFSSAANSIGFTTDGVEKWLINSSGAFNPILDNTYDIGNGTVNPRDINISRGIKAYGAALVGTPNTGVTAVTYGDGRNFTTVLTVSVTDAITVADNAALAVGYKVFDFPTGAIVVSSAYMSMAVTLAEDTTATADVGIGTTIGSGANAVLSGVGAGAENIITGQTAADCNGTATVKTIVNQILAIETGDSHSVYFNVADTWADTAGADLTGDIAGTITLNWTKVSA